MFVKVQLQNSYKTIWLAAYDIRKMEWYKGGTKIYCGSLGTYKVIESPYVVEELIVKAKKCH